MIPHPSNLRSAATALGGGLFLLVGVGVVTAVAAGAERGLD